MSQKNYIAVDLGAESGRVMLGALSAEGIQLTEVHRFPNISVQVGDMLYWDILRLWHEIKTGLAKVANEHDVSTIAGIGVDTWGVDFALLDDKGQMLGNPVCYRDARTTGMVEAVFAKLPRETIYASTGIQTMSLNTLFHLAALSFNKSPLLPLTKHILFLPDLLTYWISGQMGTDYTIASTAQMLDAKTKAWSPEIMKLLNIDPKLFPPISIPGEKNSLRGTVLPAVNEKLANAQIPVIAIGGHDTASAVAAVPASASDGDWLYLSSGTWSLLGAELDAPNLSPEAASENFTNEGGVGGKIRFLKNIAGLWLLQECKREWARQGQDLDYATIATLAEAATPLTAILDVTDPRFSTTGGMPTKIRAYCIETKQSVPETPGQFARVIYESLAVCYAKVIKSLEKLTGKKFKKLHIVGGGSQSKLLNQLAADATGLPVLAGPVEATALGNILTQALTLGDLNSLADARVLIAKSVGVTHFAPTDTQKWTKFTA